MKVRLSYAALMACLFLVLVWPLILSGRSNTDEGKDQKNYHEPLVRKIASELPKVDLVESLGAAMAPTYHTFLAAIMRYGGVGIIGLQFINSVFGLLLVLAMYWYTSKWTDAATAFLLCLPILFSSFVLGSAAWLMTDDQGWLFVVLALAGASMFRATPGRTLASGLWATTATALRQIHLWLIAPIAVSSFLEVLVAKGSPERSEGEPRNLRRLIVCTILAVAAPILVVMYFYSIWHGLTPPNVAQKHGMGNRFTVVPLVLALVGFYGFFLAPAVVDGPLRAVLRDKRILASSLICAVLSMLPPTAIGHTPSGAMVELAKTPVVFNRVIVLCPAAAVGGAVLAVFWLAAGRSGRARPAFFLIFGLICWLAAQSSSFYVLRRYCLIVPIIIIWLAALSLPPRSNRARLYVGLAALSLIELGVSVLKIYIPVFLRH